MISYEIRQTVNAVNSKMFIVVESYNHDYESWARQEYARYMRENPTVYFELVKIEHNEICLEFTPWK